MNKREQQKLIKAQKQQAAQQREKMQQILLKITGFGIMPLLALFVIYTLLSQDPTTSPAEIADDDHIKGLRENPVTIVVYADFQCPACAREHADMNRIWPQISDKAFLVFRHFPLSGYRHSRTASLYAEAAGRQGQFWEMHDTLFRTQGLWALLPEAEDQFDAFAQELNLNIEQLHADMEQEAVIAKIRNDQRGGSAAGVRATPAVFINGVQLSNPSRERIVDRVEEEFEKINGD